MPHVPPSPCPTVGCPNLKPCPDHARKPWADNRTRRQQLGATLTTTQEARRRARILRIHREICHVCNEPAADQVDHVIPLAEGGADDDSNLRPIHSTPCHARKTEAERRRGVARARARRGQ